MLHHIHLRAYLPLVVLSSMNAISQADEPNERGSSQVPDRIPLIVDEPAKRPDSASVIQVKVESSQPDGTRAFDTMLLIRTARICQSQRLYCDARSPRTCRWDDVANAGCRTPLSQNAIGYQHPRRRADRNFVAKKQTISARNPNTR